MSRSLHTDPYRVRAPRRVAAPHGRRADEARVVRRRARQGGGDLAAGTGEGTGGPPHRVDVRACPPRPGFRHPAGAADVVRTLALFGPAASYGLRRVELRHQPGPASGPPLVAVLRVPGLVVLYEQPEPPWLLAGRLTAESARRLHRAGAAVRVGAATTRVDWPAATLRDFMLLDGLMHEIGHHRVQHRTGKDTARVRRTAEHERAADAYAAACRLVWTARPR
jgi:hypothetical protein